MKNLYSSSFAKVQSLINLVENFISWSSSRYSFRASLMLIESSSPLQVAVAYGMLNIVRILVAYQADLGYISAGAWSILHYFFDGNRSIDSARYAAVLGEDIYFDDIKDSEGWTALHRCAAFSKADDVYLLHRLGASARPERYTTSSGWTPIHIAALMNNISTLEALVGLSERMYGHVQHATDTVVINSKDIHGWTPLHLSVHRRARDTTKWLLRNGGDPRCRTYRTASWFPPGYEGHDFDAVGLARVLGEESLEEFVHMIRNVGYDVTVDADGFFR
jgi:hypothetical protein